MGLFKAVFKTGCKKASQNIAERQRKTAQKTAYNKTCKDANGKFDPNWHDNYNKNLKNEQRKVEDKKELRNTFIDSL